MISPSSPQPLDDEPKRTSLLIAIVGPCGAGKSTLAERLSQQGYQARQIAQEHSFVPDMWQQMTRPDILIYLEASFELCSLRKEIDWTQREYLEQIRRLQHAHHHCDIRINTDGLTPDEILKQALSELK